MKVDIYQCSPVWGRFDGGEGGDCIFTVLPEKRKSSNHHKYQENIQEIIYI